MRERVKNALRRLGLAPFAFRLRELWRGRKRSRHPAEAADGFAIPPAGLMVLVTGSGDADWYTEGGRLSVESICRALRAANLSPRDFRSVLDFGCGCGRVIRHWRPISGAALYGADRNPVLVEWCRRNLPFAQFQSNTLKARLENDDQAFEFAYALSVFTHMPEDLQQPWMRELWRILRPGGYLLITTQGEAFLSKLTGAERARYRAGRMVVRHAEAAGTNLCSAYHPEQYVRERLAGTFSLVLSCLRGAAGVGDQDMYLLRKPQ